MEKGKIICCCDKVQHESDELCLMVRCKKSIHQQEHIYVRVHYYNPNCKNYDHYIYDISNMIYLECSNHISIRSMNFVFFPITHIKPTILKNNYKIKKQIYINSVKIQKYNYFDVFFLDPKGTSKGGQLLLICSLWSTKVIFY